MIDLSRWLDPVDGENPSGVSLRNEPRFNEIERLIEPKVEIVRDERNNPSSQITVPVDWTAVLAIAESLRERGRDLRLLVLVARALANQEALAGLAQGLTLIARTLDEHWDTMHPELRPGGSPKEAALRRTNALLQIQSEENGLLADLRGMTLFTQRGVGPITGRDLEQGSLDERTMLNEAASGLNAAERAALASAHEQLVNRVRTGCAAQADQARPEMTALLDNSREALAALGAIEATLETRLGVSTSAAPELKRFLERLLATVERAMTGRAQANGAGAHVQETSPMADPSSPPAASPTNGAGANHASLPDHLSSRDDVVKCLDLVVAFYDRTEPSSPIPHLARRIRRMVHMDFVELMEDLAPSGLKEFRLLAGGSDGKKMSQKDER